MNIRENKCQWPDVHTKEQCTEQADDFFDVHLKMPNDMGEEQVYVYRVFVCEMHYYHTLRLQEWQVAQLLREGKFFGQWIGEKPRL